MLLISYGTRPEWIKIKPIVDLLTTKKYPFELLFTGQHEDIINDYKFTRKVSMGELCINRLSNIVYNILENEDYIFDNISHVMVQGDTASSFSIALSAFHKNIPVLHLEAGLRTYNINPYPEEFYRRSISNMASIHFCPTLLNEYNLLCEQMHGHSYVVGNTVIDNLVKYKKKDWLQMNEIIITLHRRENHLMLDQWFINIEELAVKYPEFSFEFISHPNPNVQRHLDIFKNVKVISPLSYDDMIKKLIGCKMVISDSGGIQEECSYFGKHVIICRNKTERPECLGEISELCKTPNNLENLFIKFKDMPDEIDYECPFGDGKSAEKIVDILEKQTLYD